MAVINGNNSPNTLIGTPDNDTITGFAAKDKLFGKEGNDILYGDYNANFFSGDSTEITVTTDNTSVVQDQFYGDKIFGGGGADYIVGDLGVSEISFNNVSGSEVTLSFENGTDYIVDQLASPMNGFLNVVIGDVDTPKIENLSPSATSANIMNVIGGNNTFHLSTNKTPVEAFIYGNMSEISIDNQGLFSSNVVLGNNTIDIYGHLTNSLVTGNIGSENYSTASNSNVTFYTQFGHDTIGIKSISDTSVVVGDIFDQTISGSNAPDTLFTITKLYGDDSIDIKTVSSNSLVSGDSQTTEINQFEFSSSPQSIELTHGDDCINIKTLSESAVVGDINALSLTQLTTGIQANSVIDIQAGKDDIVVRDATDSKVSGDINDIHINLGQNSEYNTVNLTLNHDWIEAKHATNSLFSGDAHSLMMTLNGGQPRTTEYNLQTGDDGIELKTAESSVIVGDVGGEFGLFADNNIFVEGNDNGMMYTTGQDEIEVKKLVNSTMVGDLTELIVQVDLDTFGNDIHIQTDNDWLFAKQGKGDITITGDIQNQFNAAMYIGGGENTFSLTTGDDDISVKKFESGSFYGDLNSGNISLANVNSNGGGGPELTESVLNLETSAGNTATLQTGNDWISLGKHTGHALVVGDNGNAFVIVGGADNALTATYGDDEISLNASSKGTSTISGDVLNAKVQIELSDGGGGPGPELMELTPLTSALDNGMVSSNTIHQTFGNDWIKGSGGDDLIYGDSDSIEIVVGGIGPVLNATEESVSESASLLSTNPELDIVFVHGDDKIYAGKGNDEIHADTTDFSYNMDNTAMAMNPEAGYQVIYGNDVMSGGKGEDNFVFRVELNPEMEEPLPVLTLEDSLMFSSKGQGNDKILDFSKQDTLTLLTTKDVGGTPSGLDPFVMVSTTHKDVTVAFDDGSSIKLLGIAHPHQDFDSLQDLSNAGYDIHVETIA